MIGGAAMAHTILGIDFNPDLGQIKCVSTYAITQNARLTSPLTQVPGSGPTLRRRRGYQNHPGKAARPPIRVSYHTSDVAAEQGLVRVEGQRLLEPHGPVQPVPAPAPSSVLTFEFLNERDEKRRKEETAMKHVARHFRAHVG